MFGFLFQSSQVSTLQGRLARLERKVDLILEHLGIKYEDRPLDHILDLARQGRKIEAIKAYREATGAGLAEAKEAVERMMSQP